jgi:hypothetical protein
MNIYMRGSLFRFSFFTGASSIPIIGLWCVLTLLEPLENTFPSVMRRNPTPGLMLFAQFPPPPGFIVLIYMLYVLASYNLALFIATVLPFITIAFHIFARYRELLDVPINQVASIILASLIIAAYVFIIQPYLQLSALPLLYRIILFMG